jgi:hypothetical protein
MAFAVTYAVRRRGRIAGVLLLVAAVAACQAKNPGAPTEFASATINGTVLAPVPTGLRVSVGASSNSTPVDSAGRFALTNVLPGNVELRFTNGGATAVLPLSGVLANQTITITVTYGGSSVALESSRRVVGTGRPGGIGHRAGFAVHRRPRCCDERVHGVSGERSDGRILRAHDRPAGRGPGTVHRGGARGGTTGDFRRHLRVERERRDHRVHGHAFGVPVLGGWHGGAGRRGDDVCLGQPVQRARES